MIASSRVPIVAGLFLLLPRLAVAADISPTFVMKVGTEEELGKVVKNGAKTVFLTCPGGKTYDIDTSLKKTSKRCPESDDNFGNFAGKLLDFDAAKGSYMVMTKNGETKSLSAEPYMLKDFAKGQDLWVSVDKSPLSVPYALVPVP